jgi:hypothetical protein
MPSHNWTVEDRYKDQEQPAYGKEHRAVCSCGWVSEWSDDPSVASDGGEAHEGG